MEAVQPNVGFVFGLFAAIIIISALLVVTLKNIFHCALALIVCLSGVAGIFVLLHAEFLAAVQVLIYVGAVSILIIFSVMLTSNLASRRIMQTNQNALVAGFASLIFGGGALLLFKLHNIWPKQGGALPDDNVATIGKLLMTDYMLPFEVVSVLMLAAMIGAIVLARGESA
jgi:NADH-quinone oxidoreductase subunit J